MGENRYYKMVSVLALIIGVVGVTLGYAAFSNTLTIESSAEVVPDESTFNVDFSYSSSSVVENDITPTLNPNNVADFTATDAEIDNTGDPVITNLHATFSEPGQTATYTFYAYNAGEYTAYLNSIVFDGTKTCTARSATAPATPATASLVADACNGISLSVTVGSESATTTSVNSIASHSLAKATGEQITVVIAYDQNATRADGAFDVVLPDIVLTYDSAD